MKHLHFLALLASSVVLSVSAGCGLGTPETCFCGGEAVARYQAMEASGTVVESLKGGTINVLSNGVTCVCVPLEQLAAVTHKRLGVLREALGQHYLKASAYPETLEVLVTSQAVTEETTQDAWFKPFEYKVLGEGKFRICSGFADGVVGTEDDVCEDSLQK